MSPYFPNFLEAVETHAIDQAKEKAFTFDADQLCTYEALQQGTSQMGTLL